MSDGPDMENRDPNELNSHVKVEFEDIFGEPAGAHSADCVWMWSYKCFNGALGLCYKILTYICALPVAFCWGCTFACTAFCHIWHVTPCLGEYTIQLGVCRKMYLACLETFIGPCCETCALCFSRIAVHNQ